MTIARTRELLGDLVKDLDDQQVFEIISRYSQLSSTLIDLSIISATGKIDKDDVLCKQ
jgi:hypothetical protein